MSTSPDPPAAPWWCGCDPRRGVICSTHCQWQGCAAGGATHAAACLAGRRVEPSDRTWFAGDQHITIEGDPDA